MFSRTWLLRINPTDINWIRRNVYMWKLDKTNLVRKPMLLNFLFNAEIQCFVSYVTYKHKNTKIFKACWSPITAKN